MRRPDSRRIIIPEDPKCRRCKKRDLNVHLVAGQGHYHDACWRRTKGRRLAIAAAKAQMGDG